jgi:hypothetical protein
MKKQARKIIALQADKMRKVLKQVEPIWSNSWVNTVAVDCSKTAMSFNQNKLALLLRTIGVNYDWRYSTGIRGDYYQVKIIIVASVVFDYYWSSCFDDELVSDYEEKVILGLNLLHKSKL